MRTWTMAFVGACGIGLLGGCGPAVEIEASSDTQSGAGGFHPSPSGGGSESGTTTTTGGSDAGVPLTGAKYTTAPGYADVVWDTKRDRVFLSSGGDGLVRVLDLKSGAWTSLELTHRAEHMYFDAKLDQVLVTLAAKEHSSFWDDADQFGYLGRIDAATLAVAKPIQLPLDPWEIVSDGAGYAYISGASGQHTHMVLVNLATGKATVADSAEVTQQSHLQLHPTKTRIYTSQGALHRFDISGELLKAPYPGNIGYEHSKGGALRMPPDGTTLYLGSGNVFLATNSQDSDMTWSADVGIHWSDLAFRPDGKLAYAVPDKDWPVPKGVAKPLLYAVDTTSLQIVTTYTLDAPAERVLASDAGLLFVRGTLGGDPKTEVEVVLYGAL